MYRALTWWFITERIDRTDPALIAARAAEPSIEVSTDPDDPWTRLDGRDVSSEIRTQEVSAKVSAVARVPAVREHLIARQRAIIAAADPGVVAEGRDIGTVVAPAAQLKVFLTADPGARARRRAAELSTDAGETEAAQARRDRLDAAQSEKAADAVLLDATDLTLGEVIDKITGRLPDYSAAIDHAAIQTFQPASPLALRKIITYTTHAQNAFQIAYGQARGVAELSWSPKGKWIAIVDGDATHAALTVIVPPA